MLKPGAPHAPPVAATSSDLQHFAGSTEHLSTVTLNDGTTVDLGFGAVIDVHYAAAGRDVVLTRGQAFFVVSKDAQRPFTVQAGEEHVLAVGTQFDVRLQPDRVEVVLLEGSVTVSGPHHGPAVLAPGHRLIAAAGERPLILAVDAQRLTAWRSGWISFENESLVDAVDEFNRYSSGPPIVTEPAARSLRLGGAFRLGKPDRFAAAVQELLPVTAVSDPDGNIQLGIL